jgi:hypothetical protein
MNPGPQRLWPLPNPWSPSIIPPMPQNGNSVTLLFRSEVAAVLASEAVEPVSAASDVAASSAVVVPVVVEFVPAASDVAASPPITAAKAVSSTSASAAFFLSISFHLLFVLKQRCPNAY